jgi:hypothetical protein
MEHKKGTPPGENPLAQGSADSQGEKPAPTSRRKRILALIGAILMVILTLVYTYSLATGAFLKW